MKYKVKIHLTIFFLTSVHVMVVNSVKKNMTKFGE